MPFYELAASVDDVFTEQDAMAPEKRQMAMGRLYRAWKQFVQDLDIDRAPESRRWVWVYALVDPQDGEIRYVGKAVNPYRRLLDHVSQARRGDDWSHKSKWIARMLRQGRSPSMILLETVAVEHWPDVERTWIAVLGEAGFDLVNTAPGGYGGNGAGAPGKRSEQAKANMSRAAKEYNASTGGHWIGRRHTAETLRKLSESHKGKVPSQATRAKMSAAQRARYAK